MAIYKNGKKVDLIYKNGKKEDAIYKNGAKIYSSFTPPEIKPFATANDDEIAQYLDLHYQGIIDIANYWHIGDTRVMHLNAMAATPPYAEENHVAQNMTVVIIGFNHDNLKAAINGKTKAAITLQCRELLGNNGNAEDIYIWGTWTSTSDSDNYSNNPRRTWLNGTFINALPSAIKPLVKTVVKKNINNHSSSPSAGPNTEDKAFLTSYPEMFGSASYSYYKGSVALEGEQYPYYDSNTKRIKHINKNGSAGDTTYYWLRSPSSAGGDYWMAVYSDGTAYLTDSHFTSGLAPAFCL